MTYALPQNKILVAFSGNSHDGCSYRTTLLQDLFNLDAQDTQKSILKDLRWRTRYYECSFDLYIDEFEDFEEWLTEFNLQEFDELREALAGIIVVADYDPEHQGNDKILQKFANCLGQSSFNVWCNTRVISQEKGLDANRILHEENTEAEMVEIQCDKDINEYGEKLGLERLKEIIDIHEWHGVLMPSGQIEFPK